MTSNQTEQTEKIKFTVKQKNVMKLLAEDKSYRDITEALGITRPTLRSHSMLFTQSSALPMVPTQ